MPNAKRVLLVEDEPDYCADIADFLRQESFDVLTAANGNEGLQQFANFRPDLIISDIQMPNLSGLEMLEKMNQHYTHQIGKTPFVFLTAWGDKQYCTSAKTLGCDDFLQKPVDFDMLLTTLHGKLNKWQRVESSFEHDHALLQHVLMHTLRQRIHKPIHSMMSYAQVMNDVDIDTQKNYSKRLDEMARKQLVASQCMSDTLSLNQHMYQLDYKATNPTNTLWECAVSTFGFDVACHFAVQSSPLEWSKHIMMDQHLCNRMFGLWMDILAPQPSHPPHSLCSEARYNRIEIIIATTAQSLQHVEWIALHDLDLIKDAPELLHRYGCELLFSLAVAQAHSASISIAAHTPSKPAIKWSFAAK